MALKQAAAGLVVGSSTGTSIPARAQTGAAKTSMPLRSHHVDFAAHPPTSAFVIIVSGARDGAVTFLVSVLLLGFAWCQELVDQLLFAGQWNLPMGLGCRSGASSRLPSAIPASPIDPNGIVFLPLTGRADLEPRTA